MNAADVIGWYVNGDPYCPACTPSTREECGAIPVFGDSETDSFSHCADCEELIPEGLTTDGYNNVIDYLRRYLTQRVGRPEIQKQWAEHVKSIARENEEDKTICELVIEACDYEIQKQRRNA